MLFKEDCFAVPLNKDNKEFFAKDLRILLGPGSGRDIKDIIVVDNLINNFIVHYTHCIPIKDFDGFESDSTVLKSLTKYLMKLKNEDNIQPRVT